MDPATGPTLLGFDIFVIGSILSGVAALAVLFAIYTAVTIKDPMSKRVKALEGRREELKMGLVTAGTKKRSKRSVNRWVGDFCVSASLTIFTTLASVLSFDRRVTSISMRPLPLIVPAKTLLAAATRSGLARAESALSTGSLSTGMLSPVTGAWLIALVPLMTKPSAGRRSFGRTMAMSPTTICSTGISLVCPPRRTVAVSGASFASASIAFLARPIA